MGRHRIDDVAAGFSAHAAPAMVGLLCVPLFSSQSAIDAAFGSGVLSLHVGRQLGVQLLGLMVIFLVVVVLVVVCVMTSFHD